MSLYSKGILFRLFSDIRLANRLSRACSLPTCWTTGWPTDCIVYTELYATATECCDVMIFDFATPLIPSVITKLCRVLSYINKQRLNEKFRYVLEKNPFIFHNFNRCSCRKIWSETRRAVRRKMPSMSKRCGLFVSEDISYPDAVADQ
jgi:hypothetical protein